MDIPVRLRPGYLTFRRSSGGVGAAIPGDPGAFGPPFALCHDIAFGLKDGAEPPPP